MSNTLRIASMRLRPQTHASRHIPRLLVIPQHTRTFFGLGQILGVLANPAETIRSLNESKDLLKKAKEDLELQKEAKQIPKKHTFSKLPGFHGREAEQALLRKVLANNPKLTVIFGATSVGKTALLRQVLATEDFYVINFDLRISGFANLRTLYIALCEQFQQFFESMGDEEMHKQMLVFKHLTLELADKEKAEGGYSITVADIASLMESLQSCLLKYWEYDPEAKVGSDKAENAETVTGDKKPKARKVEEIEEKKGEEKSLKQTLPAPNPEASSDKKDDKPKFKKKPLVFFLDEAHKMPALVDDTLSLKVFLDTLLVLTKQDRLCHVFLATSDSFFQHFLRTMNVGHHSQLLTIGDCTKEEAKTFYDDQLPLLVPEELRAKLSFDEVYDAFGGKLSHISDYLTGYADVGGELTPYTSAIFIQAYTLLQFHLTRKSFETFSPLTTATAGSSSEDDAATFTPEHLLHVMRRLVKSPFSLPYFELCREIGTGEVDSMIRTRVLELRWTKTVSPEEGWVERCWSEDGVERPIVLPMTRIMRKAMEVILKEEDRRLSSPESMRK